MLKRALLAACLSMLLVAAMSAPVRACPACKEAVASQPPDEANRLKTGYFYSIIMMVSMPLALAGIGVFAVARAVKRGTMPEL